MAVIAMTREMGSLGKDVALALAEEMGLRLVQHEVVDHVAEKMHLGASTVNRFLEGKAGMLERWGIDEKQASLYTAEEIFELAAQGDVLIRGWGASFLLRTIPHVVCVRVCAPIGHRVNVLMDRIGLQDRHAAAREIEKNDAAHSRTMSTLFHINWQDPLLYDLVLNTARVPITTCVAAIKRLVEDPAFQQTPESRRELQKLQLQARVRAALKSNPQTRQLDNLFEISVLPEQNRAVLAGMVENQSVSAEAERTVLSVPGIDAVDNQLLVATRLRIGV